MSGAAGRGEVVVVGAGVAGLVAALRLAEGGRRVRVLAKGVGSTHVSGGTVDVLGYAPDPVVSPAAALDGFLAGHPDHPYARIGPEGVAESLAWLKAHLVVRYVGDLARNFFLPTALGVAKPAALAPQSMAAGDLVGGGRVVVVGLPALKDFYPGLVAGNLSQAAVPSGAPVEARAVDVAGFGADGVDLGPLGYARRMDQPGFRAALAGALAGRLDPDETVALPAVVGLAHSEQAWEEMEARLERPVCEIATLPPSVPGLRLYRALSAALQEMGGRVVLGAEVVGVETDGPRVGAVLSRAGGGTRRWPVEHVVLATGGWTSGGLAMDDRRQASETVVGLPVTGVPGAVQARPGYLDEQPLRRTGVAVDTSLRPVGPGGEPLYRNVRVAGATLAGADPWREKSGEGISVASGFHAASSILAEGE